MGGVSSLAYGGGFLSGFAAGGVAQFVGGGRWARRLDRTGQGVVRIVAGGLASLAGGGKFKNGAMTAAFAYAFNELGHLRGQVSRFWDGMKEGFNQIKESLRQRIGAINAFRRNYFNMRKANTIGADKYFHCIANCEAAQLGETGAATAGSISNYRELFDFYIKGSTISDTLADQEANNFGREQGLSNPDGMCPVICDSYRPDELAPEY